MEDLYKEFLKQNGYPEPTEINLISIKRPNIDPKLNNIYSKSIQCGMTNYRFKNFMDHIESIVDGEGRE